MTYLSVLKSIETPNYDKFTQTPAFVETESLLDKYDFKKLFSDLENFFVIQDNLLTAIKSVGDDSKICSAEDTQSLLASIVNYLKDYTNNYLNVSSALGSAFFEPQFSFLWETYRRNMSNVYKYLNAHILKGVKYLASSEERVSISESVRQEILETLQPLLTVLDRFESNKELLKFKNANSRCIASIDVLFESLIPLKNEGILYKNFSLNLNESYKGHAKESLAKFLEYTLGTIDWHIGLNLENPSIVTVGVVKEMKNELNLLIQSEPMEVI